jgi:YD repeat-containing protein
MTAPAILHGQSQIMERGFKPDAVYQLNGFDSVNLFNGNLILTIPLGTPYPVSAGLSYSFVLRYSGQLWRTIEICHVGINTPEQCRLRFVPDRGDNVGFGWHLSFGELKEPVVTPESQWAGSMWTYQSADGGEHVFFRVLHEPECAGSITTNCDTYASDTRYTRDDTYLRLKEIDGTTRVVEFPDGIRQRFTKLSDGWHIEYMYTPFSAASSMGIPAKNYVHFQWDPATKIWTISDTRDRSHTVTFGASETTLVLAAFGGQSATYTLPTQSASLKRPCSAAPNAPAFDARLLTSVTFPSRESYSFQYDVPTECSSLSGTLTEATLPTLGKIQWTYHLIDYQASDTAVGVQQRLLKNASNASIAKTTYDVQGWQTTVDAFASPGDSYPDVRTVHYFQANEESAAFGLSYTTTAMSGLLPNPDDNTLPLSSQRWLSSATYDCSSTSGCPSTPERAQYVRYESDTLAGTSCDFPSFPCWHQQNRRVASERTLYVTDSLNGKQLRSDINSAQFDGLGHYREQTTDGNFPSGNVKKTFTNFNPGAGTYTVTSSGGRGVGYNGLSVASPWVLDTFTDGYTEENDVAMMHRDCFDAVTGFLKRKRVLTNTQPVSSVQPGAHDLLAVFTTDQATATGDYGYVGREEYFGGDWQNLSTSPDLCGLSLPVHDAYSFRIDHSYSSTTETAKYVQPDGTAMPILSTDLTMDLNTGLVSASRDASGLQTNYEYDSSGRLTRLSPPGEQSTAYAYTNASGATPASVSAVTGAGERMIARKYEYDAIGRLFNEKRILQLAEWSNRQTQYDGLGRKTAVSEEEITPAHWTTFSNYDAFGRVGRIITPDNSTTNFVYTGARETTRQTQGGGTVPINISSTETYDRFGRLKEVKENSGTHGELVTTSYWYDAGDRLTAVKMADSSGLVQNRTFDYDGRGLLRWESQPESGMKSYTYDARGHVITSELGAAKTAYDLKYQYDSAERLTVLSSRNPTSLDTYHPMKVFTYGIDNGPAVYPAPPDYRKGKVLTAARYNYPTDFGPPGYSDLMVKVTETYAYKNLSGRRTHRDTSIATQSKSSQVPDETWWATGKTITQSFSYDDLGELSAVNYPMCLNCGTPDGTNPTRNLTSNYDHGHLTSMSDFVTSINYFANGMRYQLQHSNGIADTQLLDPSGMARPGTLSVSPFQSCKAPVINSQTLGTIKRTTDPKVTLSVNATGTGLSYQWYITTPSSSPVPISGAVGSTCDVQPAADTSYFVDVWNTCRSVRSQTITVKVGDCVQPWLSSHPIATRNTDGTYTLSASAFGTGTLTYVWKRLSDNAIVGSAASIVVSVPVTTSFSVSVTNTCGGTGATDTVIVSVQQPAPALSARRTGPNQITITWGAVAGATSYYLDRWTDATGFMTYQTLTATQFVDANLPMEKAYIYRVRAMDGYGELARSGADVATTISFTTISESSDVSASQFNEILSGINAVRTVLGWASLGWNNILSATDSLPAPGRIIQARHLTALRGRLNESLQAAGMAINGFTDSDVDSRLIRLVHITELRDRLQ